MLESRTNIKTFLRLKKLTNHTQNTIDIHKEYAFDHVFHLDNSQTYNIVAKPQIDSFLCGYNIALIAYGQTNSGKTFTIQGHKNDVGLLQRALFDIYCGKDAQDIISISYVEIYNEEIHDLLSELSISNESKVLATSLNFPSDDTFNPEHKSESTLQNHSRSTSSNIDHEVDEGFGWINLPNDDRFIDTNQLQHDLVDGFSHRVNSAEKNSAQIFTSKHETCLVNGQINVQKSSFHKSSSTENLRGESTQYTYQPNSIHSKFDVGDIPFSENSCNETNTSSSKRPEPAKFFKRYICHNTHKKDHISDRNHQLCLKSDIRDEETTTCSDIDANTSVLDLQSNFSLEFKVDLPQNTDRKRPRRTNFAFLQNEVTPVMNDSICDASKEVSAKRGICVREDPQQGIILQNCSILQPQSFEDCLSIVESAFVKRRVTETKRNSASSRSHAVFTIYLDSEGVVNKRAKFHIIDLAGSEKVDVYDECDMGIESGNPYVTSIIESESSRMQESTRRRYMSGTKTINKFVNDHSISLTKTDHCRQVMTPDQVFMSEISADNCEKNHNMQLQFQQSRDKQKNIDNRVLTNTSHEASGAQSRYNYPPARFGRSRDAKPKQKIFPGINIVPILFEDSLNNKPDSNYRQRSFIETCSINKSLLVLGTVIEKLSRNESFINYRDSKLTFLLKDCLSGNSMILLIGTIDYQHSNLDESYEQQSHTTSMNLNPQASRFDRISSANESTLNSNSSRLHISQRADTEEKIRTDRPLNCDLDSFHRNRELNNQNFYETINTLNFLQKASFVKMNPQINTTVDGDLEHLKNELKRIHTDYNRLKLQKIEESRKKSPKFNLPDVRASITNMQNDLDKIKFSLVKFHTIIYEHLFAHERKTSEKLKELDSIVIECQNIRKKHIKDIITGIGKSKKD